MEGATNNWFSNKYSIGYALSGGFIKGFAHLGAMQALLEHDIKPNIISGVSAGALAGVFYADGNEPHKVLDYFAGHKFQDLTKLVIPKVGLFEREETGRIAATADYHRHGFGPRAPCTFS